MADVKETVIIEAKTEGEEDVKKLSKAINDSKDATEKQTKASEDLAKQNKKTAKDGKKGFTGLKGAVGRVSSGFKALGGAMKAAGIGLIIGLVVKLTQAFGQNQAIMDGVNKIFTTINIVFQEVTSAITNAFQSVSQATGGFQALGKVMSGLLTLALTPLKVGFFGIKLAVKEAQLAWEQSVFGDDDPKTVKRLNEEIANTKKELAGVAVDAVNAGKDIVNNFGDAVGEIGDFTSTAINNISEVSIAGAIATSEKLVEARKNAELAQAQIQGLIEQYDREAEVLRQQRDDIRLTIDERIKANDELNAVLEKQLQQQLKLARQGVRAAELEIQATGDNIANQRALIEAKNEVLAVEAQITGFQSEQRVNEAALQEERRANLEELRLLGTTEAERKAIESETELERQRTLIERTISNEHEKNRLLELAEQEHQNRLSAIKQEQIDKEKEVAEADKKIKQKQQKQLNEQVANEKSKLKESIGALAEAVGLGKEFAIAEAIINTFKGVTETLSAKSVLPEPFGTISKIANSALILGTGFENVRQIKGVKVPGGGGGGGQSAPSGGGQTAPAPPSFNLVGQANTSAITQPITETEERPVQAFVVSKNVTTAQQADRNAESASTF